MAGREVTTTQEAELREASNLAVTFVHRAVLLCSCPTHTQMRGIARPNTIPEPASTRCNRPASYPICWPSSQPSSLEAIWTQGWIFRQVATICIRSTVYRPCRATLSGLLDPSSLGSQRDIRLPYARGYRRASMCVFQML